MIVPLGNGGDTRLSVPVPARAVTPSRPARVDSLAALRYPMASRPPAQLLRFATKSVAFERSADDSPKGQVAPAAALSSRLTRPFARSRLVSSLRALSVFCSSRCRRKRLLAVVCVSATCSFPYNLSANLRIYNLFIACLSVYFCSFGELR